MEYSKRIATGSNGYVELVTSANGRRCYRAVSHYGEGSSDTFPEDKIAEAMRYAEIDFDEEPEDARDSALDSQGYSF